MAKYLVIALYDDDAQRFAEDYEAGSPDEAEEMATIDHPGLTVAGVVTLVEGKIEVVS
jgi:hypothetical protein